MMDVDAIDESDGAPYGTVSLSCDRWLSQNSKLPLRPMFRPSALYIQARYSNNSFFDRSYVKLQPRHHL
ncbi:hypothetical protein SERLA73DRAFT_182916 [Serpula lacrymans var. lacrymans S7.3]|uniref:Uncharacterized protein n=2 Tax=Serpula lacrymans var. lacrymans TaxID=341189 RepID=F8Q173_SERL3|nr:uncharacterized protein SERLADRAFT_469799 [Serpula lacrymans var. lacrymans S7.9]EGN98051.1 hypothetical protein SERLA73DRAFT_182916 [Serpula lacrymans var. lacrymans S7.3]EGO23641.1 hypothetical protein SERLADRAFT_469799 [Serpula lacrymans var. lacrymans S7.9]